MPEIIKQSLRGPFVVSSFVFATQVTVLGLRIYNPSPSLRGRSVFRALLKLDLKPSDTRTVMIHEKTGQHLQSPHRENTIVAPTAFQLLFILASCPGLQNLSLCCALTAWGVSGGSTFRAPLFLLVTIANTSHLRIDRGQNALPIRTGHAQCGHNDRDSPTLRYSRGSSPLEALANEDSRHRRYDLVDSIFFEEREKTVQELSGAMPAKIQEFLAI